MSQYTHIVYYCRTPLICFRIIASKMLIFEILLPLKEPLVATFGEKCALTSRKYIVVQAMNLQNHPKNTNYFGYTSPFSIQNNSLKMLVSEVFVPVREPLVATFSETRAATSAKDIVKRGMNISKV